MLIPIHLSYAQNGNTSFGHNGYRRRQKTHYYKEKTNLSLTETKSFALLNIFIFLCSQNWRKKKKSVERFLF